MSSLLAVSINNCSPFVGFTILQCMYWNLFRKCFKLEVWKLVLHLSYWTKLMFKSNTFWPGSFRYSTHGVFSYFNAKFTYFKIFDVTWDFDSAEWYSNTLKSQHKDNKVIAIFNGITRKMWFLLPAYRCLLSQCWASSVAGREYMGCSQLKPAALFKVYFVGYSDFIVYVGLNHLYSSPCQSG